MEICQNNSLDFRFGAEHRFSEPRAWGRDSLLGRERVTQTKTLSNDFHYFGHKAFSGHTAPPPVIHLYTTKQGMMCTTNRFSAVPILFSHIAQFLTYSTKTNLRFPPQSTHARLGPIVNVIHFFPCYLAVVPICSHFFLYLPSPLL